MDGMSREQVFGGEGRCMPSALPPHVLVAQCGDVPDPLGLKQNLQLCYLVN